MTSRGASSAGATCPACGVGTPAAARFWPACGQPLGGGVDPEAARDLARHAGDG